jgi:hypothetical protein
MEDQLTALGERWAHICHWTEERCNRLQNLAVKWSQVTDEFQAIQQWLNNKEMQLKQMEANPVLEIGEVLDRIKKLQVSSVQYSCSSAAGRQLRQVEASTVLEIGVILGRVITSSIQVQAAWLWLDNKLISCRCNPPYPHIGEVLDKIKSFRQGQTIQLLLEKGRQKKQLEGDSQLKFGRGI